VEIGDVEREVEWEGERGKKGGREGERECYLSFFPE
jgi:hypothetical protein